MTTQADVILIKRALGMLPTVLYNRLSDSSRDDLAASFAEALGHADAWILPKPVAGVDEAERLYGAAEDAVHAGMTAAQVRQAVENGISSVLADRTLAREEMGQDLYPQLADEEARQEGPLRGTEEWSANAVTVLGKTRL